MPVVVGAGANGLPIERWGLGPVAATGYRRAGSVDCDSGAGCGSSLIPVEVTVGWQPFASRTRRKTSVLLLTALVPQSVLPNQ